jgi:hypothetical protein
MNYDQLIRNWHAKAITEDFFSGFVFEYLAFIAFLKKQLFTEYDDRRAIQLLKRDEEIKSLYLIQVRGNPEILEAWNRIIAELGRRRLGNVAVIGNEVQEIEWWNCNQLELNQKTQEEKEKVMGVIYDLNDWGNMVEFIYSIRNNLFHGGKNPEDERDQLLVSNGLVVLRPLVDIFLTR